MNARDRLDLSMKRRSRLALVALALAGCGTWSPVLEAIEVGPQAPALAKGAVLRLVATGRYADSPDADLSRAASWASTDPTVVSVDQAGMVRGVSIGTAEVTATMGQVTGRVLVNVGPPVPVAIEVTPSPAAVPLGLTVTFTAQGYVLSDGSAAPLVGDVTWTSMNPAMATVDGSGLARSRGVGRVLIRAAQGALVTTVTLTIGPPIAVAIAVTPTSVTVFPGRTWPFTATATMTDGTTQDISDAATWSSSDPASVKMLGSVAWCEGRAGAQVRASLDGVSAEAHVSVMQARIAFATSSHGKGDLGSWNYGVGATGLAAADAICRSSAMAGRLPGTYRAWLSDSRDEAYCRMHRLPGTVATRCGQAALPASAGPWMRTDGTPYAARIDRLVNGETYTPLAFDEYGFPSHLWPAFTGSTYTGARDPYPAYTTCGDWSSTDPTTIALGAYESMTSFASGHGALSCDQNGGLICLEVADGEGPALPPRSATGKLAFMTSVRGPGMLGAWPDALGTTGLAAGDAICRARAAAAGFPNAGRYRAWLSDATTDAISRLTSDGPWVRPDGVLVAANREVLASGYLSSSISVTETGRYVNWSPGVSVAWEWSLFAWTGTTQQGLAASNHCASWTASVGATAVWGATNDTTNWSDLIGMGSSPCTELRALYCFED
jgi:hypothetical protein